MKISVLVAACNQEALLSEQLDSILSQTVIPDEIIVGDDSSDSERTAVREMILRKNIGCGGRILLFPHEKPLGTVRNFEDTARRSSGDVLFFCDHDDVWMPQKVERFLAAWEKRPECDGIFSDSALVASDLRPLQEDCFSLRGFLPAERREFDRIAQLPFLIRKSVISGHNIAVRRRALNYLLPFPELPGLYADTWLTLAVSAFSRWGVLDEELCLYRQHGANLSGPRRTGLLARFCDARLAARRNALTGYENCVDALLRRLPTEAENLVLLEKYRSHLRARQSGFLAIAEEFGRGGYFRFDRGIRSFFADLCFRAF